MNPGYLSLLLMVVTLILFASGWKDMIVRGITNKVILLFFVLWFVGMKVFVVFPFGQVSICVFVLIILIGRVLWRLHGIVYKLHMLSVGILLGSITFFLLETIHLIPSIVILNPDTSIALLISVLVSSMTRIPVVQIASISIGLLLGETYFRYLHREHLGFQLGSLMFQDRWWMTVFLTRGISLVMAGIFLTCKKSFHWLVSGIRRRSSNRE